MLGRGSWAGDVLILVCDLPLRNYKKPATYCTLRTETGDNHIWFVGCPPPPPCPLLKIKAATQNA